MSENDIAVKVDHLSKVYRLWNTPRDRMIFGMRRMLAFMRPGAELISEQAGGFRQFYALDDISFEIRKGESWGFVGVNGSGKSTLLKIISGNLRPSMGRVAVDGKVAILDYGSGFNGEFTGKENIYIKAALSGLTRKAINARLNSIIEFAELGDFINQPVKTYSSGMSARLGFAIMAHVDADIIITDEALAVGDVFFVQKCMKFIRSFLKKGTFLFVSHSTNDVLSLCQNAVWLNHGKIKEIGQASDVVRAYLDNEEVNNSKNIPLADDQSAPISSNDVKNEVVLGASTLSSLSNYKLPKFVKDARADYVNNSALRNDICVCEFNFEAGVINTGIAEIINVIVSDESGAAFSWFIGGEMVGLSIEVSAKRDLKSPIVGFQIMDRLGQVLFADNSYLLIKDQPVLVKAGSTFVAEFTFQMPLLPVGDYVVRAAVAVDDEGEAKMIQAIDNAVVLRSVTSGARHGLVGVPMHSIKLRCSEGG